jgi:hypothetical protein
MNAGHILAASSFKIHVTILSNIGLANNMSLLLSLSGPNILLCTLFSNTLKNTLRQTASSAEVCHLVIMSFSPEVLTSFYVDKLLLMMVWGCGLDSFGSGQGQVAGSCEHGNEPSGSIKCGEFLD